MKYIMTSNKWEGGIELEYYEKGYLKSVKLPEEIDIKALFYLATHFPTEIELLRWLGENTSAKIEEYIGELTFDEFWDAYDKKTGSKELARQLWEGDKKTINKRPIQHSDRIAIMRIVKRYTAKYRAERKEFQPLASTFLYQRRWESEIEAAPKRGEIQNNYVKQIIDKWTIKNNTNEK